MRGYAINILGEGAHFIGPGPEEPSESDYLILSVVRANEKRLDEIEKRLRVLEGGQI